MNGTECIGALKALGEENRLRILRLLLGSEQNVNAISATLDVSPYNVSKHLGILRTELTGGRRLTQAVNRLCPSGQKQPP